MRKPFKKAVKELEDNTAADAKEVSVTVVLQWSYNGVIVVLHFSAGCRHFDHIFNLYFLVALYSQIKHTLRIPFGKLY
jgi:hypothetical protein